MRGQDSAHSETGLMNSDKHKLAKDRKASMGRNSQILRVFKVLQYLDLNPHGLPAREILRKLHDDGFNPVRETVYKDLATLQEAHMPIVNEGKGEDAVWKLKDHIPITRHVSFEFNELMALFIARESLGSLESSPLKDSIESLFSKLENVLGSTVHRGLLELSRNTSMHPGVGWASAGSAAILDTVQDALNEGQVLQVEYQSVSGESAGKITPRRLGPLHLMMRNAGTYLIAIDLESGVMKQYALPRIKAAVMLDEPFDMGHFDPDEYYKSSLGTLNMGDTHEIELFIREPIASFIEERRFHSSQRSVRREGGVALTMSVRVNDELVRWVLSLGGHAQVVRPLVLREKCVEAAEAIIAVNRPKKSA